VTGNVTAVTVQESQTPHSKAPVLERLRARGSGLSATNERIAQVVRDDPSGVVGMTVSDLASASRTSVGSVVRFCQELGFKGFQELKLRLAGDVSTRGPKLEHSVGMPGRVLLETAAALNEAVSALDSAAFARAEGILAEARQVLVAGIGTSAPVAADAAYRLQLAGLATIHHADAHAQDVAAALLQPGDACLTVSHTGQTQETLAITATAREAGAHTIGLCSFAHSPLTQQCDEVLVAGSAETGYRLEAMTSRFVHLAVVDALYVALSERDPQRAETAQQRSLAAVARHRL